MDRTSMNLMREIVEKYDISKATVVDVGSYDINGSYKDLFPKGKYIGADITPGPNVDVLMDSNEWKKIKNVDAVISGSTLEHVTDIPKLMKFIYDALKPGGLLCVIVPSQGPRHYNPKWIGNIPEKHMIKIMVDSGFEVLESMTNDEEPWHFVRCVGRKKGESLQLSPTEMKPKASMKISNTRVSNVSLAIGIPCSFPSIPIGFFNSFVLMEKPSFQFITCDNGPIDTLRNDIVEKALKLGVTKLIMMDIDMVYHPKTITSLLARNLPIVGALSFRRYPPFDSIMLKLTDTGYQSINEWEDGELVEVDATGAACIMYDMSVFKKMPGPWFKFRKKDGLVIGEDVGFCQELQMAGYKIFVDTSVPSSHLTTIAIDRNMNKLWEQMKVKQLKMLDKAKAMNK